MYYLFFEWNIESIFFVYVRVWDREWDKQPDRQTESDAELQAERGRQTERGRQRDWDRQTDRQKESLFNDVHLYLTPPMGMPALFLSIVKGQTPKSAITE